MTHRIRIPQSALSRRITNRFGGDHTFQKVLRIYYEWCFGPKLRNQTAPLNPSFNSSKSGGAGESRTPDTQFRKLLLYPSELQPHRSLAPRFYMICDGDRQYLKRRETLAS
jgi:hypothetical protein